VTFNDRPLLLAVDLGLACGLAWYDDAGVLVAYRSQSFKNITALKASVLAIIDERPVQHLVVEGDRHLGEIWLKAASKRGATGRVVHADVWRGTLLLAREQERGVDAKATAQRLALQLIQASPAKNPKTPLMHDVAEAILIGLWGCLQLHWIDRVDDALGR
jgi:hypothetical protein